MFSVSLKSWSMIQARLIRKHVFIGELEVVLAALIESVRDRRYSSCRPHSNPGRRSSSPRAHSGQPAKKQKDQKKEKEPAKEKGPDRKEKGPRRRRLRRRKSRGNAKPHLLQPSRRRRQGGAERLLPKHATLAAKQTHFPLCFASLQELQRLQKFSSKTNLS